MKDYFLFICACGLIAIYCFTAFVVAIFAPDLSAKMLQLLFRSAQDGKGKTETKTATFRKKDLREGTKIKFTYHSN